MTGRRDVSDPPPGSRRETFVWRVLVASQVAVLALIVLSLLGIFLMGAFGSLFAQRTV